MYTIQILKYNSKNIDFIIYSLNENGYSYNTLFGVLSYIDFKTI